MNFFMRIACGYRQQNGLPFTWQAVLLYSLSMDFSVRRAACCVHRMRVWSGWAIALLTWPWLALPQWQASLLALWQPFPSWRRA